MDVGPSKMVSQSGVLPRLRVQGEMSPGIDQSSQVFDVFGFQVKAEEDENEADFR